MWQARYLGQHCRDTSKLLKLLRLRESELLSKLKHLAQLEGSSSPPMNTAASTLSSFLHSPCCGGTLIKAQPHHPALIGSPLSLVAPSSVAPPSRSGALRPHFLGRGLFTRNASHLVPLRRPEVEKRDGVSPDGSPRARLDSVRRKDPSDDTAVEQQVRYRSNQAVRRQEIVQDYQDVSHQWPQSSDLRKRLNEVLAWNWGE